MAEKNILVVEDEVGIRGLLEAIFGDWGYSITAVSSAEEAVATLESGDCPDLVILDLRLPGAGGETVLTRIKELGLSVPAIVYAGGLEDEDKQRLRELGARAVFTKPTPLQQLKAAIEDALPDRE